MAVQEMNESSTRHSLPVNIPCGGPKRNGKGSVVRRDPAYQRHVHEGLERLFTSGLARHYAALMPEMNRISPGA